MAERRWPAYPCEGAWCRCNGCGARFDSGYNHKMECPYCESEDVKEADDNDA